MKKKKIYLLRNGAIIAFFVSSSANLITFGRLELTNVLVGTALGGIIYFVYHY